MSVIIGRAQHLPPRQILERRRDAPADRHRRRVDGRGDGQARQGRAESAQQEHGLDQIALSLLDRQRRQIGIVE
jgi:hypothetical protein